LRARKGLEAAASVLWLTVQRLEVRVPEDFDGALKAAVGQRAGGLFMPGHPLVTNRPRVVADLALKYRLPTDSEGSQSDRLPMEQLTKCRRGLLPNGVTQHARVARTVGHPCEPCYSQARRMPPQLMRNV